MTYISDSDGIHIGAPVSIYDVQKCLGSGSCDLATLCMLPNVNMWSGIKPIWHTKITPLSDSDRAGRALSGFKTGGGIKKKNYTWSDYKNSMPNNSHGNPASEIWAYDKPTVGDGCAFRLTDFAGYYHNQGNVFLIGSYITNLDGIPIPSSPSSGSPGGAEIEFYLDSHIVTGCVAPQVLFGDCLKQLPSDIGFFPAIILSSGNGASDKHYVKTADNSIDSYLQTDPVSGDKYFHVSFKINTETFARAISGGVASAYSSYPLRNGDQWTACVVLLNRQITGSTSDYTLNNSDTIIRLEYEANVDRWTLPIKQNKYSVITSMKLGLNLSRQQQLVDNHYVYKITFIDIIVEKATNDSVRLDFGGWFQCQIGNVYIPNGGRADNGNTLNVQNLDGVVLTGTGTKTHTLYPNLYYEMTNTTVGNQLCNGGLNIAASIVGGASIGEFQGGWSLDVYGFPESKSASNISII